MRIKHTFTTDFNNLHEVIKFYLEVNGDYEKLQNNLNSILVKIDKNVNYKTLLEKINLIRVHLKNYDTSLAEVADICSALLQHETSEEKSPPLTKETPPLEQTPLHRQPLINDFTVMEKITKDIENFKKDT